MPIIKSIRDIICFKCKFHTKSPKIWQFSDEQQQYTYILCEFCTVRCDKCLRDIIATNLHFTSISSIKDTNMIICQKCKESQIALQNTQAPPNGS